LSIKTEKSTIYYESTDREAVMNAMMER
jgi:hypothetical protein